ncbi:DUF1702 family protein [Saccharothrix sp. S26]|uniref:DUF1702 family protein n=1 Tax=Saccharothrix sp. S26 TaxID=2907215 RepID=UPI001F3F51F0|nr:DUF1702 family protein [Saccharothrix sp. S26]MCE6996134.1 DUF1702 family protein [Saccharothrix sp. S26]
MRLLSVDPGQVDFGRRRFRLRAGPARGVLESAARAFLSGLNAVLDGCTVDRLAGRIGEVDPELRGFACEGAGMGCALLDLVTFGRGRRVAELLTGPGSAHPHLVHVGIGWAYALLRLRPVVGLPTVDPLLRWLSWDGFGFHQGFFHADRAIGRARVGLGLPPGVRAVRDQGLGRALWFHECADPEGVALRIAEFPPDRRADLWSGVGLAATYAGGADAGEMSRLVELAGRHRRWLAQGCAFACKARHVGAVVPAHTDKAAELLAGVSVAEAAGWTDRALAALGERPVTLVQYGRWRAETGRQWEER